MIVTEATTERLRTIASTALSGEDAKFLVEVAWHLEQREVVCGARVHVGGGMFDSCPKPKNHPGKCR